MSKNGRLGWAALWFTVDGRATRFDYWMRWVVPYFIGAVIAAFLDDILGTVNPTGGLGVIMVLYFIAAFWPNLAVGIKRCHDRGRSGWFLLIGLVPLLNLWLLVELAFLRGTPGTNRFGADPLDGMAATAADITT